MRKAWILCIACTAAAPLACSQAQPAAPVVLEQTAVVQGFSAPESCLPDAESGMVYVSNVEPVQGSVWADDGEGFISKMTPEGGMQSLRWRDSYAGQLINAPRGMCILDGFLYFADNGRLMRMQEEGGGALEEVPLPRAAKLNDVATDGEAVYVSDTQLGVIYAVTPGGEAREFCELPGANGVAVRGGAYYAVSWSEHDVFRLDPEGDAPPEPLGMADQFTGLDGIEILEDGRLLVSDFKSGDVFLVDVEKKEAYSAAQLETPADLGVDRERGLVFVPDMNKNRVVVFELKRAQAEK